MSSSKLKILIAPSNFKESMSATTASQAIEDGIIEVLPKAITWKVPLADGGTGTVDSFLQAVGGEKIYVPTIDPLGRKMVSYYGLLNDKHTAVIEMAASSGLALLSPSERNPMLTTSYGCGELILHAVKQGTKKIILGVGDTATVDGGIGLLQALGVKIFDITSQEISKGGKELKKIAYLDISQAQQNLAGIEILVASDVTNPLLGTKGAAAVFAPQKGATQQMVKELEQGLSNWSKILSKHSLFDKIFPGTGAAGGAATGLMSFFGAKIISGSKLLFDYHKINEKIALADLVFTGEGSIDTQTLQGKMPAQLALAAKRDKVPLIAFTGNVTISLKNLNRYGFYSIIPIVDRILTTEDAYQLAPQLLKNATIRTLRLISLGKNFFK